MKFKVERYNFRDQFSDVVYKEMSEKILQIIKNGQYILSDEVDTFEQNFAKFHNAKYAISCNSGTDALILALMALGITYGDEVIIPANTFYATALAVCKVGAVPVLVDANEKTFLINPYLIESKITPKTKAIIVVHLYGLACDLDEILLICKKRNLKLIEDCAQAHGAKYNGEYVGNFGIGCFSLHPSKNLPAAGDAGIITTNSYKLKEKFQILRNLGQKKQNEHLMLGMNSRLDAIQAVILNYRLDKLAEWNEKRYKISEIYKKHLKNYPVQFQECSYNADHVYHLFQINCGLKRDELLQYLISQEIDATIRYPTPIHKQPAFKFLNCRKGEFIVAETLSNNLLCLPLHPLLSEEDINYVINCCIKFFTKER